jgi:hypothetical protein
MNWLNLFIILISYLFSVHGFLSNFNLACKYRQHKYINSINEKHGAYLERIVEEKKRELVSLIEKHQEPTGNSIDLCSLLCIKYDYS